MALLFPERGGQTAALRLIRAAIDDPQWANRKDVRLVQRHPFGDDAFRPAIAHPQLH
jgi:hypothetical protein